MRHLIYLFSVLMLTLSLNSFAEGSKIAVVDFPRAMFETELAKARVKQLSSGAEFTALQTRFESINADIKAMQQDAEANSATWSKEQGSDYQVKLKRLLEDRELTMRKVQSEQQSLQGSIVKEIQPKAGEAIKELMEEGGFDVLVNAEAVIFAKPEIDLTAKLTDRLNKKIK